MTFDSLFEALYNNVEAPHAPVPVRAHPGDESDLDVTLLQSCNCLCAVALPENAWETNKKREALAV